VVIRTEKYLTITEAHPFHRYIRDDRAQGGHAVVEVGYDARCPLCRAEASACAAEASAPPTSKPGAD
jgi:hypothetical protein